MRISAEESGEQRSVGDRMVLILDTVASSSGEVGLSELARRTGLKKATVHRLAMDLVAHRMLERGGYGYRLGLHLFELGQHVPASRRLRATALPFMADLLAATGEVVQLGVLDGTEIVYIEKLTGRQGAALPSSVGTRLPAYCTGLGKAILAYSDESAVDRVTSAAMPARTGTTITDPRRFQRELEKIRDTGIAYDREEGTRGVTCVAAAIVVESYVGRDGHRAVAGLSVTGPSHRLQPVRLGAAVRTAALSISRLLGYPLMR
ncbi:MULTISPECIES: IclR family transcriptional regulator [Rhodococcus]|uniref:IclR family transcriptional regulator n=1 Tax=Rhodococcus oxybenzonivorans TaxID=1990687 RepID=A0AAE4UZE9_9NOCA|nr:MULTISPECIES: IclR family transcriptional regulator [Rhodococcus]MDV7241798.1 IclR family transcriptional regulator [Rhodococcus oxybenzonivorans]MDV7265437.1 IclR family transcriptional regulator [Rhodococcus oxybenzonivorans]MDV7273668.1 IclR family transcriptional regulator [Rhodococcus oxybenzonivorans]MDV7334080.1 IclR family transcriptional regulator [Rhodococcus oxybenzonivorans]MDV7343499.1 IclR family transcriptional regulator [Rhodococcus oxybenzonivorans]